MIAERASAFYGKADAAVMNITKAAAVMEAQGSARWPRAVKIIRFAESARSRSSSSAELASTVHKSEEDLCEFVV